MATPWIKVEVNTPDKPEVIAIAGDLGLDLDAAFGKIYRIWAWFDQHTENGHAPSVTKVLLNRLTGVTNFCETMIVHGWMIDDGSEISLPNFEVHNGETAKRRAQEAKRKEKSRKKSQQCHANTVTQTAPKPSAELELDITYLTNYTSHSELFNSLKQVIAERSLTNIKNRALLQSWLDKKITGEILKEAIERAQSQTDSFNVPYLNTIVVDLLNPKQKSGSGSNGSNKQNNSSASRGIDANKAAEEKYRQDNGLH